MFSLSNRKDDKERVASTRQQTVEQETTTMAKPPATTKDTKNLPTADIDQDFEQYAGEGLDNVGADDLLVPRLGILQSLSPQLKKSKSEYIEGAEDGMIADLGTGELFPDGLWFLPVMYRKEYIEWAPRDSGKGLVAIHPDASILDETTKDDRGRPTLENGNYIAETAQFYGLNLSAGGRMSFIPMTSTQLKKARRLNTLAMGEKLKRANGTEFTAPLWYRTYHFGSAEESNNEGDWSGWTITRGKALPEIAIDVDGLDWRSLKETAIEFRASLIEGKAKGDVEGMEGGSTAPSGDDSSM